MYVYDNDIFVNNFTISLPTAVYVFSILWEDRPTLCTSGVAVLYSSYRTCQPGYDFINASVSG